jgi:hypothetical protein
MEEEVGGFPEEFAAGVRKRMAEGCLYTGTRDEDQTCQVRRVDGSSLPLRLDLVNHSPTGFEWGYGGSGPAQLALAILADYLKDDVRAVQLHQSFKWACIARLPQNEPWSLTGRQVEETLDHVDYLSRIGGAKL